MAAPSTSLLGLLAEQHRSHEQRLDRAAAVRRKRVAFGTPRPFRRAEGTRLVEACHGVLVAPDENPDVLVLASRSDVLATVISDDSSLVVDADEFLRMVGAYAETHRSRLLAAAVAAARSDVRSGRPRASDVPSAMPALTRAEPRSGGLRVADHRRLG